MTHGSGENEAPLSGKCSSVAKRGRPVANETMITAHASTQPHGPASGPVHEFRALITPHRSLGPRGFRLVMALVLVSSVVGSLPFVFIGAWPVAGFFGLDLLALFVAFRLSYYRANAFEEIVVDNASLFLRKVSHTGEQAEWRLNPLWTTLLREHDEEFGLLRLSLASRGAVIPVAEALSAEEREGFAAALAGALSAARRGELRPWP